MQKLNRFVTYIYSYRDSQRDTNVGFAKVDSREDRPLRNTDTKKK